MLDLSLEWTVSDSAARLLAAPEALMLQQNGANTRLIVASRGEPGFGALDLSKSGAFTGEEWHSEAACAGLTGLSAMTATSGMALATGWSDPCIDLPFSTPPSEPAPRAISKPLNHIAPHEGGPGIALWQENAAGTLTLTDTQKDTRRLPLGDTVAHTTLSLGKRDFAFTASSFDAGVASFKVKNGTLQTADIIRPGSAFPAYQPSCLDAFEHDGTGYLLAGASGSGTLSLFKVAKSGALTSLDTAYDDHGTRFAGISEIASGTVNGRPLIAATGSERGLTIFELTDRDTLRPLLTTADGEVLPLGEVSEMLFGDVGSDQFLFLSDRETNSVSALRLDIPEIDKLHVGKAGKDALKGGAGHDVLDGKGGADKLKGNDGDDQLFDGKGRDKLTGGEGADLFIFDADKATDKILDFEPGIDRIDLSAIPMVQGLPSVIIKPRPWGALLLAGDERIIIRTADQSTLTFEDFDEDDFIF
ncbi:MAG: hypothetical protein AAFQ36_07965 [Pseudomonadota bacterium]